MSYPPQIGNQPMMHGPGGIINPQMSQGVDGHQIMPGASNLQNQNTMPGDSSDMKVQDDKVLNLLYKLISDFSVEAKIILYRTFDSLVDRDVEEVNSTKILDCDLNFENNLKRFRYKFPRQKPLFRNVGFIAQRIGKQESFREMFNRPKVPPFLLPNLKSHARTFILANYADGSDIEIKPQVEESMGNHFFVGFFFNLSTKNGENALEIISEGGEKSGYNGEKILVGDPKNGYEEVQPVKWLNPDGTKALIFIMTNPNPLRHPSTFFKITNAQPKTLFMWFCVQSVEFSSEYVMEISHGGSPPCIVKLPLSDNFYPKCPNCYNTFSWSNVTFSLASKHQMMQQPPFQPPFQFPMQPPLAPAFGQIPPPVPPQQQAMPPQAPPIPGFYNMQHPQSQMPPPPVIQQPMPFQQNMMQQQYMKQSPISPPGQKSIFPTQFTPQNIYQNIYKSPISPSGTLSPSTPMMTPNVPTQMMTPMPKPQQPAPDLYGKILQGVQRTKNEESCSIFGDKCDEYWNKNGCENEISDDDSNLYEEIF